MNLGMNRNRAGRTVANGDIAGARQDFEVYIAIDLERTVEGSDDAGKAGQRRGQNKNQHADGAMKVRMSHGIESPGSTIS